MPLLCHKILPLDSIFDDGHWSLHQDLEDPSDQNLSESIARIGLLRPPITRIQQRGHELICGARRIAALRQIDDSTAIVCSVVTDEISNHELLLLVAEDQLQSGPLSPIESARFVTLYNKYKQKQDIQLLNRATGTTSITRHKRLCSLLELEPPILSALHHGHISEKSGLALLNMLPTERIFVSDLIMRLALNGNKQRRFLELVGIATDVQRCTIEELISERFAGLYEGAAENAPQQSHLLMQGLHQLTHPESTMAERKFHRKVAEAKLPENCRITHSPAFETDKVTLEVDFVDFDQFSRTWEKMKESL